MDGLVFDGLEPTVYVSTSAADRLVVRASRLPVLVVAGLVYKVSPIDLIPETIPGAGFLDDAVVVGFVIEFVHHELDQFPAWDPGQDFSDD